MLCTNCQREIGNKNECPFCGYNPQLDASGVYSNAQLDNVYPKQVRIVLRSSHNGKANAAFILSFFGMLIIPGIISLIFALVGFFQAGICRSGRGKSIAAMAINLLWIIIYVAIFSNI